MKIYTKTAYKVIAYKVQVTLLLCGLFLMIRGVNMFAAVDAPRPRTLSNHIPTSIRNTRRNAMTTENRSSFLTWIQERERGTHKGIVDLLIKEMNQKFKNAQKYKYSLGSDYLNLLFGPFMERKEEDIDNSKLFDVRYSILDAVLRIFEDCSGLKCLVENKDNVVMILKFLSHQARKEKEYLSTSTLWQLEQEQLEKIQEISKRTRIKINKVFHNQ